MEIRFKGGVNIAMKIPPEKYDETVAFYRDILLFDVEEVPITHPTVLATHRLEFGPNILWLDCVKGITDSKYMVGNVYGGYRKCHKLSAGK